MAIRKLSKTPPKKVNAIAPVVPVDAPKGPPRGSVLWLLQEINSHRVDPSTISPELRRACLTLLVPGKHTCPQLAEIFRVSPSTIRKDLLGIRDELGREIREYTPEQVVGRLALAAEKYAAEAYAGGDVGLAWSIERDLAKCLKEFGFLGGTEQGGVRITIEAMGEGYGRASKALAQALDPRLTGEVIEVENEAQEVDRAMEEGGEPEPPGVVGAAKPSGSRPALPFKRGMGPSKGPRAEVVTATPDVDDADE